MTKWYKITEHPPPFDRGILITDGKEVIAAQARQWEHGKYYFGGYGYFDWTDNYYGDSDLIIADQNVTHWTELPNPPAE